MVGASKRALQHPCAVRNGKNCGNIPLTWSKSSKARNGKDVVVHPTSLPKNRYHQSRYTSAVLRQWLLPPHARTECPSFHNRVSSKAMWLLRKRDSWRT